MEFDGYVMLVHKLSMSPFPPPNFAFQRITSWHVQKRHQIYLDMMVYDMAIGTQFFFPKLFKLTDSVRAEAHAIDSKGDQSDELHDLYCRTRSEGFGLEVQV